MFSSYNKNKLDIDGKIGIACGGISYAYVKDAIEGNEDKFSIFKVATPYPFPTEMAEKFLTSVDKIIVFEELDPVIEDALIYLCGEKRINADIYGKRTEYVPNAGELSTINVAKILEKEFGIASNIERQTFDNLPATPVRPPVLCSGCPHRGSFYAVKQAMKGRKAIYTGDIGCYTLGNAAPLDMVDTCLCMGAGITIAQGLYHADKSTLNFAFVGDSTFFASGITGVINAVYNQVDMVLVIVDNSTTAMTGHQPHPGTGITMMDEVSPRISIEAVLKGIGLQSIQTVDPLDHKAAVAAIKKAAAIKGVRAIIFKSPCIAVVKTNKPLFIDRDQCIGCKKCIKELGCPALSFKDKKAIIDKSLCTGCSLCSQICPQSCIRKEEA